VFTGAAAHARVPSGFALSWSLQPWRVNSNLRKEAEDEVPILRFVSHSLIRSRIGAPDKKSMTTTRIGTNGQGNRIDGEKGFQGKSHMYPALTC
jgi:hypothetical protein